MVGHPSSSSPGTVDPYVHLQLTRHPDGSVTRHREIPRVAADRRLEAYHAALSDDVDFNLEKGTWLRIYLPRQTSPDDKLPVVVYVHGGGFIHFNADSALFHNFCSDMSARVKAIVVSVDYRLAPEHRLPAAYDDTVDALRWIMSNSHDWMRDHADVSNCILMGTSAGGNIAYHVWMRVGNTLGNRIRIRGLVLHHPFFGGTRRTESETRLANDPVLPLSSADLMWELSLPVGATRQHEYSDPSVGRSCRFDPFREPGRRVIVTGYEGDPLIDRQKMLVELLAGERVHVEGIFCHGGHHAIELINTETRSALFDILVNFTRSDN